MKLIANTISFVIFLISMGLNAQFYSVFDIPKNLTENADGVIRNAETKVEFLAYNKAIINRDHTVTVLNDKGLKFSFVPIFYDKMTKIVKFTAELYDAFGREMKKLKAKDLRDVSAYDGFSLYIDDRIQYYEFTPASYPFTVHYSIETISSNTINLPGWTPIWDYRLAVEQSFHELINQTHIEIQKDEKGFDGWPVKKEEIGNKLSYSVSNLEALQDEVLSPVLTEITPGVRFSPNEFQLEGVNGSFENWQQFGKWYYDNLLVGKYELSEKDKTEVSKLIDGISDPYEKVRILYQYMQQKTRYVNVAIGIGGWEPFPASYVSEKSYGDCKALSNYMVSLLKFVGIDAFHTIVFGNRYRKQDMDSEFASLQGNHMIVNVPMNKDTIWLECTSQKTAFNYLGDFTDDRNSVSVTPQGGKIVRTQHFPAERNNKKTMVKGELFPTGKLILNINSEYSGLEYDSAADIYFKAEKDQIQEIKNQLAELPGLNLVHFKFENDRNQAVFKSEFQVESQQYASIVGNSLMLNLLSVEKAANPFKKDNNRKYPFEIRFGYTDEIEFELKLPKGYRMADDFKNILFSDDFGTYIFTVKKSEEGKLKIYRKITIKDGEYPKEKFNDFVEFYRRISSSDNSKILIEKA